MVCATDSYWRQAETHVIALLLIRVVPDLFDGYADFDQGSDVPLVRSDGLVYVRLLRFDLFEDGASVELPRLIYMLVRLRFGQRTTNGRQVRL
jgi:hypothetical protein